jgi:ABC-type phosphate transport system permease subunit
MGLRVGIEGGLGRGMGKVVAVALCFAKSVNMSESCCSDMNSLSSDTSV